MREIIYDNYYWQNDLVRLRAWSEDDWEWDYYNNFDSEASRLADCEIPLPPTAIASQEFSEIIKDFSTNNSRTYFAIETLDGTLVGRINLYSDDEQNGTFEIATKIDTGYRGKGYGTAAMRIILKYAFMERRLNKYCAGILEGNLGSIAMHEKLGCEQEGVCKQNIYTNGRYYDEICFGLTKDMYLKNIAKK
ncbi:acetyltransferase family protein [Clostridium argentinense CDC 2741]|uniref:Acetyltransferase family protein n=1 Tax=Clostridium argentinense CDC 2741 TaxID=1418104 RepID=A0A0C1R3U8_9CLOT|nr:GNAT family protein [Clostridium argentinense]ARC84831.1 N-acetyltransferase [Clostridium argentinense]KIE48237.1 acetyltransferase family protein [Clostridium argentinense CDC 2741]NFF41147.1 GNAT family N-acetyltransferase [Clostridium argentinense]NFP51585.1 GNAT family N-acetyltransferase [Clostridium argentinense]NFP74050.1 GNAT family N-acetyltransferase [Clostridium argentinense]